MIHNSFVIVRTLMTISYVMVFFVFAELRSEVVVCFVDINGIVVNHCLNFPFIILNLPLIRRHAIRKDKI